MTINQLPDPMDEAIEVARNLIEDAQRSGLRSEYVDVPDRGALGVGSEELLSIRNEIGDCVRCPLSKERKHIVFGVGNPHAELMIVGEAPGRDEDMQAEPFVGRAGKLLTDILMAIGLSREDVYICNVVKCRPPQNRNPEPHEMESCELYLKQQMRAIAPKLLLTVGEFATQALLRSDTPISELRGNFADYEGVPLMPTYHPAFLLRNPAAKKHVWEDVKKLHARLTELTGHNYLLKGTK